MPEVHVVPVGFTAKWRVHAGDPSAPLSEHMSTTDAEAAARRCALRRGADQVVVHDRYHRTRLIRVPRDDHERLARSQTQCRQREGKSHAEIYQRAPAAVLQHTRRSEEDRDQRSDGRHHDEP
jgi:hypothetical protein